MTYVQRMNSAEHRLNMHDLDSDSHYTADHLIAKVLIYVSYLVVGGISIETANPYVALVFGTALWLFGINGAAYAVEVVRGHEHLHKLI